MNEFLCFCIYFGPLPKIVRLKLYALCCPVSTCHCASNRERPWPLYMTMQYSPISGWFLEIRLWYLKLKELSLVGCLGDMLGLWNQACASVCPLGSYFTNLSGWKLIVIQIILVHWNVNVFSHWRYNWYLPNRKLYVLCCAKLLQSYLTLCNPTDCSPAGSSVHGILQARILSGLLCPPPGDLTDPGMELTSHALAEGSLPLVLLGKPRKLYAKDYVLCL